ncbi:hypothetical protein D3C72_2480190 [compost metagenome]
MISGLYTAAISAPSMPITDRSSGIFNPFLLAYFSTSPRAMSLAARSAVGGSFMESSDSIAAPISSLAALQI